MKKQILGSIFLLIASILYSAKYISAAISGVNSTMWGEEEFSQFLSFVPLPLNIAILTSLVIGLTYFVWGILDSQKEKNTLDKF